MTDEDVVKRWIVQHRTLHPKIAPGDWMTGRDYTRPEPAQRFVDAQRALEERLASTKAATVEWRVIRLTQKVVY